MGRKKVEDQESIGTEDVGSAGDVLEDTAALSVEERLLAEKKAEAKKKRDAARSIIRNFLNTCEDIALKNAITLFVGSGQRASGVSGVNNLLYAAFKEHGSLTEMEVFKQFHIGRPDMKNKVRIFIKFMPTPEDRIWVSFNPETETYTMDGEGANPPEGWEGYIIVEENVLDEDNL